MANCSSASALNRVWIVAPDNTCEQQSEPNRSTCLKSNTLYRALCGISQQEINTELSKCDPNSTDCSTITGPFSGSPYYFTAGLLAIAKYSDYMAAAPCIPTIVAWSGGRGNDITFGNPYYQTCLTTVSNNTSNVPNTSGGAPIANNNSDGTGQEAIYYQNIPIPSNNSNPGASIPTFTQPVSYTVSDGPSSDTVTWNRGKSGFASNPNYNSQLDGINFFMTTGQVIPPNSTNAPCCIGATGCVSSYTFPPSSITGSAATIYPTSQQVAICTNALGPTRYNCRINPNSSVGAGQCVPELGGRYASIDECNNDCGCYQCAGGSTCQQVSGQTGGVCRYISGTDCQDGGCSPPGSNAWIYFLVFGVILIIMIIVLWKLIF